MVGLGKRIAALLKSRFLLIVGPYGTIICISTETMRIPCGNLFVLLLTLVTHHATILYSNNERTGESGEF